MGPQCRRFAGCRDVSAVVILINQCTCKCLTAAVAMASCRLQPNCMSQMSSTPCLGAHNFYHTTDTAEQVQVPFTILQIHTRHVHYCPHTSSHSTVSYSWICLASICWICDSLYVTCDAQDGATVACCCGAGALQAHEACPACCHSMPCILAANGQPS